MFALFWGKFLKRKHLKILFLLVCFVLAMSANAKSVNTIDYEKPKNIIIHLTGNGIATRLHKPILDTFDNVVTEFVYLSDTGLSEYQSGDWLILGTPVYKQKNHIISACRSYSKILCEKPVALSLNEIDTIKEAISQNNTLFRVNYALRFLPVIDDISEFMAGNEIKSISVTCNANFNSKRTNREWKNDYKLGGGILYSIFPHFIDLLNFLKCEPDLHSIFFESTTKVPMNDINFSAKTLNECTINVNINLCQNFDELTIKIETEDKTKTFDLINAPEYVLDGTKYLNDTLSATSEVSPWRISFKNLLKELLSNPNDYRLAKIEDAEKVHKVLRCHIK